MESSKIIASNVRDLMKRKGLLIKDLSRMSGLSLMSVNRLRKGDSSPTTETLDAVAKALGVPVASLLTVSVSRGLVHDIYPTLSLEKRMILDEFASKLMQLGEPE